MGISESQLELLDLNLRIIADAMCNLTKPFGNTKDNPSESETIMVCLDVTARLPQQGHFILQACKSMSATLAEIKEATTAR